MENCKYIKMTEVKSGVPSALSEDIYYIATEMTGVAEALLMSNKREEQVLTNDAKRLLEISKILKEKGL